MRYQITKSTGTVITIKDDKAIDVTDVRIRKIKNNNLIAIASITLNNELIINDINVSYVDGVINIKLPNSEFAKSNRQYSIIPQRKLFHKIKKAIIEKLNA